MVYADMFLSIDEIQSEFLLACHKYSSRLLVLTLEALPRQWVALETVSLQFLRSRMLTSVSPFFFMSLLMVSMYRNFGLPLGLTPSTTMSSTVLVIWLWSLRLTCPYQRRGLVVSASGVLLLHA